MESSARPGSSACSRFRWKCHWRTNLAGSCAQDYHLIKPAILTPGATTYPEIKPAFHQETQPSWRILNESREVVAPWGVWWHIHMCYTEPWELALSQASWATWPFRSCLITIRLQKPGTERSASWLPLSSWKTSSRSGPWVPVWLQRTRSR